MILLTTSISRQDEVFGRDTGNRDITLSESAVDQVLSKRFVKKQQMSWSRRGAHLLLQVRTRALNEELREKFDEWYPGLVGHSEELARAA
jgi:hypothetical protein